MESLLRIDYAINLFVKLATVLESDGVASPVQYFFHSEAIKNT